MLHYIRKAISRLCIVAMVISTSALLIGCSPEAPPCNDPQRIESVLRMVGKGHDEDLGNYKFKSADFVSLEAGAPAVTSYDESIKRRSCEVHLTLAFKPTVVQKMNFYMDWMGDPLGSSLKYGIPELFSEVQRPQQFQIDAAVIRSVTGDRVSEAPLRLPVAYKIVKDEGKNTFSTSVSYSTATTTPYLKVASNALAFDEYVRNVLKARGKAVPASMQYGQSAASSAGAASATPSSTAGQSVTPARAADSTAAEQVEQAKLQKAADMIAAGNPQRGAETPVSSAQSPATSTNSGPENIMAVITRYEACGEEAVCLHTAKGNTVWMQAAMLRRMDFAMLDTAIRGKTPVCLQGVARTEGRNFSADGLDSQC
ncbi:hypothetical protein EJP67_28180 [Variovorax guangxiensis]|uniref:DUF4852 domain-containing protein n=1 Tax=Variovorax guangxiensis TaxID=1775474 RepID=A0A3S1A6P3_9BURK|nr:hypothetical protein [Variovorax guangxiensis]RUR70943.1 hypothetical protein EJP67_28180 [Variovorax guangxiensis]